MAEISEEILIEASPEKVWRMLTDFPAHETWNPFLRFEHGSTDVGTRIRVRVTPPGGSGMTFRPRVVVCDEPRRYGWQGSLGVPGIFDGRHEFVLEEAGPGRTLVRQQESFRGILLPLLTRTLVRTQEGFRLMNAALKRRVEEG